MYPLNEYALELRGREIVEERRSEMEGGRLLKEAMRAAARTRPAPRAIPAVSVMPWLRLALAAGLRAVAARVDPQCEVRLARRAV